MDAGRNFRRSAINCRQMSIGTLLRWKAVLVVRPKEVLQVLQWYRRSFLNRETLSELQYGHVMESSYHKLVQTY